MFMLLAFWILAAYGMTTIIVYSHIFEGFRNWVISRSNFFGKLITCMMCTSFWVGAFMSICLGGLMNHFFKGPWIEYTFFDSCFTSGAVWALNGIIEFFEESRIR
jgi:hypothetical protein